ncbi:MAG: tRNA 4-thiouridine(8) synthase ThiI [Clostridia bacterium]|nr:tRNA 4-thiouridine(8) synthase ThiI [Clostridia bacterium]
MRQVLLVRYGEVHLKGQNRPYFLRRLTENVKHAVAPIGAEAWLSDSRIYVAGMADMDEAVRRVTRVFGLHSVSPAWELDKDYSEISAKCVELTRGLKGSFKVMARRSDKRFPMNSQELNVELGGDILEANPDLRVDVHKPDFYVSVEIRDHAYVYIGEIMAAGGLPLGTGGRGMLLLSGGIDSPVAGYQMMKRGVSVNAVHFFSFPYTSERAKEKVLELARIVGEYGAGMKVYVVPFTDIQLQIHEKCPDEMGTLIMRRYMMRIANEIARKDNARALITGESLGQVASQTIEALGCTDAVAELPVLRPLISFDKQEIIDIAVKIGTYETSSLPYEDCCTVFTPRHPLTKPRVDAVAKAEEALDTEALVKAAVEGTEEVLM